MTNLMQTFNEQVYISSTKKRLGQTPVSHLPPSVDPYKTTFGIRNKPDELGEHVAVTHKSPYHEWSRTKGD
ncbi:unnamed protein product [Dicrocoelium dendriticum]|nr:unnamed protein product [Dicrocoelium dendriticum]